MIRANGRALLERLKALRSLREIHESDWRDCFDYISPARGMGFVQQPGEFYSAKSKQAALYDSTGTDAARRLASALLSGLVPANNRWFQFYREDVGEDTRGATWYDDTARTLWVNIQNSDFQVVGYEAILDTVISGLGGAIFLEEGPGGGLYVEQWPLHMCYFAKSAKSGIIDICFRRLSMTAEQAANEFGRNKLPEKIQKVLQGDKGKPDEKFIFVHAIYPRNKWVPGANFSKNFRIASVWFTEDGGHMVKESGYHEIPFAVPRWMITTDGVYARGPSGDALPDVKTLNKVTELTLAAADIAIGGVYLGMHDGVLNPNAVRLGARRIIPVSSTDSPPIVPLKPSHDFNVSNLIGAELKESVRKGYLSEYLTLRESPAMTATEVLERKNIQHQVIAPIFGRFQTDFLKPIIERAFWLCQRAGCFAPPPPEIAGMPFSIKYLSPLARAENMTEVAAMDRYEQRLAAWAEMNPAILDIYNFEDALRHRAHLEGVPYKFMREKGEVETMRQQRAEAEQSAMQEQQQMELMGDLVKAGAKRAV